MVQVLKYFNHNTVMLIKYSIQLKTQVMKKIWGYPVIFRSGRTRVTSLYKQ